MNYSEDMINSLRDRVKSVLSEQRYLHTCGVERASIRIGTVLLNDRVSELRCAALLHDITKEKTFDENLELIGNENPVLSEEDFQTLPALHSFSAPYEIFKNYSEFATKDILSATFYHTVGCDHMTIFNEIIFLSDYVEDGRKYYSCKKTAEFLYSELEKAKNREESVIALHRATLMAINFTEEILQKRNQKVNTKTVQFRDSLLKELENN